MQNPPLGKPVPYGDHYDPTLLFSVPRAEQRKKIGIESKLPFTGADIWNAYELSWLDTGGKPHVAMATAVFPCESPNIIESKSFKLYLNSFNQTQLSGPEELEGIIARDLGVVCGSPVEISIVQLHDFHQIRFLEMEGESLDFQEMKMNEYSLRPEFLQTGGNIVTELLTSNLLKTNCPVTGQPDWASIQIRYRGAQIDRAGLLRYIVSFRSHSGFHEDCVEQIFMDITRRCSPLELSIYARYTRRGGIDINPFRTNAALPAPPNFRTARQ